MLLIPKTSRTDRRTDRRLTVASPRSALASRGNEYFGLNNNKCLWWIWFTRCMFRLTCDSSRFPWSKVGRRLCTVLYSVREPSELLQWLCHDDSAINIVLGVIIILLFLSLFPPCKLLSGSVQGPVANQELVHYRPRRKSEYCFPLQWVDYGFVSFMLHDKHIRPFHMYQMYMNPHTNFHSSQQRIDQASANYISVWRTYTGIGLQKLRKSSAGRIFIDRVSEVCHDWLCMAITQSSKGIASEKKFLSLLVVIDVFTFHRQVSVQSNIVICNLKCSGMSSCPKGISARPAIVSAIILLHVGPTSR